MNFKKTTESESRYNDLEKMPVDQLLLNINREDQIVALAVKKVLPAVEELVKIITRQMKKGGRLFYIGAGTSGRLGILDASECPPTYGIEHGKVIALIAGGDTAIRKAVEFAEDDTRQGWRDLMKHKINKKDVVVGIAASGTTPYVLGAIEQCNQNQIYTGCITCNANSPLSGIAKYPIAVVVGPEFVTGSTRMKSGTAQKMILNMISTSVMIKLGRVKGNKMVDMKLSNEKLVLRGTNMIIQQLGIKKTEAEKALKKYGSVRKAIQYLKK